MIIVIVMSVNVDNVFIFIRCVKIFKFINFEISVVIIFVVYVFKNGVLNFG